MIGNKSYTAGNLKVVSWNINGIRSFKNLKETLDHLEADIICLQETKVTRDMIDEPTALVDGYNSFFSFSRSKSGYSGVATYCREHALPIFAEEGLSGTITSSTQCDNIGYCDGIEYEFSSEELKTLDCEGRTMITQHKFVREEGGDGILTIFNVYCPRADPEKPERLTFKLRFYKLLELRASALKQSGSLVMIVGDVNTSHKHIDRCENVDQEEFEANPSRQWLNSFLVDLTRRTQDEESFKMIDSFRYFHCDVSNAFTCWNTKVNARATNYGSRIDYILVDRLLITSMVDSLVLSEIFGSDHCPVAGFFKLKLVKSLKTPSLCTKNFPEFSGVQQKLSSFFEKKVESFEAKQSCVQGLGSNLEHESLKRKSLEIDASISSKCVTKKLKTQGSSTQKQISHFFLKSSDLIKNSESSSSIPSSQGSTLTSSGDCSIAENFQESDGIYDVAERIEKSVSVASAWRMMLSGPRPPPLCMGHKEPCVERTVKKKGSNFNRKFFACARGEGSRTDPRARCDHFEWAVKK